MNNQPYEYEVIWEKDYTEGGGNMGVAIDSKDNIIVCGINKSEDKGIVVKYDKNGEKKWSDQDLPTIYSMEHASKKYSMPTGMKKLFRDYGYFFDVAVDSRDNIVVAGTFTTGDGTRSIMYVKKYDSEGNKIWERNYTPFFINLASGIAIDSNDDIIIAGGGGTLVPLSFKGCVIKIRGINGRMIWKRMRRRGVVLYTSVIADAYDDVLAAGFSRYNDLDLIITKFGGKLGLKKGEIIKVGNKVAIKIAKGVGNFVVSGKTENNMEMQYLLKFDQNFNILWEHTGVTKGFLYGIALMKNEEIVVSGHKDGVNEYYAALYNGTGNKILDMFLGERVSNLPDDYMRGIAVDSNNDVVITGARTVGKTMKVRIKRIEEPSPPSSTPKPPAHEHPKESWLQRFLKWLFGR